MRETLWRAYGRVCSLAEGPRRTVEELGLSAEDAGHAAHEGGLAASGVSREADHHRLDLLGHEDRRALHLRALERRQARRKGNGTEEGESEHGGSAAEGQYRRVSVSEFPAPHPNRRGATHTARSAAAEIAIRALVEKEVWRRGAEAESGFSRERRGGVIIMRRR